MFYTESNYAQWHYAECNYAECCILSYFRYAMCDYAEYKMNVVELRAFYTE